MTQEGNCASAPDPLGGLPGCLARRVASGRRYHARSRAGHYQGRHHMALERRQGTAGPYRADHRGGRKLGQAAHEAIQRRAAFMGTLACPAPTSRTTGRVRAVQGQIVDIVLTRARQKSAGLRYPFDLFGGRTRTLT